MTSFSVDFSVTENGRKRPEYDLVSDLNGEVSLLDFLEFTKQTLVITAGEVLKEEQGRGFDLDPLIIVDGRARKPVTSVSPLGQIEIFSRVDASEVVIATYDAIISRSPVDTGLYVKSHYVFFNGSQIATDRQSLTSWFATDPKIDPDDVFRIVNIQPYARKLERLGVTAQRTQNRRVNSRDKRGRSGGKILVPNGAYFLATRSIRREFKRNNSIKFSFISGSELGLTGGFKTARGGARNSSFGKQKKPGRSYLYPSITINVSEKGNL